MSVINQVLIDLEKRGTTALPSVADIRPVPLRQSRSLWLLAAAGLLGLAAAGLWWSEQEVAPPPLSPATIPITAAPPSMLQPPVEAPRVIDRAIEETAAPAMRLSLELSTIPPPSGSRNKPSAANSSNKASTKIPSAPAASAPAVDTGMAGNPIKQISAQQQLENEFRRATMLLRQGRSDEAYAVYQGVLQRSPGYDAARQAMVGILLERKRNTEAEQLLEEGLQLDIKNTGFAMLLARLQMERNALPQAIEVLRSTLPFAGADADYQAFIAALLQRQNSHQEAVEHYQIAVRLAPNSGVWLMGMGISLQALQRNKEALDTFKRAIESGTLNEVLRKFVNQRLKELG